MRRVGTLTFLIAVALSQLGWDTTTIESGPDKKHWASIYAGPNDMTYAGAAGDPVAFSRVLVGNEHTELAHYALLELGFTQLYDVDRPTVLDLNESIYRPMLRDVEVPESIDYANDPFTLMAERYLLHPARFSGIPDFSYTMYDWLNKNALCPALPPGLLSYGQCHNYLVWLGAALNSSHFGDQATEMYKHYHRMALGLAENARQLQQGIEDAGAEVDRAEAEEFVKEAELEALSYEGIAQHYLQDRWSSGHMWNRFNGPSFASQAAQGIAGNVLNSVMVGASSGIIHGAEALLKLVLPDAWVPDPMCSPPVENDTAMPVEHTIGEGMQGGVGDYRFHDMLRQRYGEFWDGSSWKAYGFAQPALDVQGQLTDMMRCAKAGWADVARGFRDNGDGTYGAHMLAVTAARPTFSGADFASATGDGSSTTCWDHWATNEAMVTGISNLGRNKMVTGLLQSATLGSLLIELAEDFVEGEEIELLRMIPFDPASFGRLAFAMRVVAKADPKGTSLADGTLLPSYLGVQPGQRYLDFVPPDYSEPNGAADEPFADLPDQVDLYAQNDPDDRPGRDKHSIYGFFNKAHTAYWCEAAETKLPWNDQVATLDPRQGLRWPSPLPQGGGTGPSDEEQADLDRRLHACRHIADRLHKETTAFYMPTAAERSYAGEGEEARRLEHGDDSFPAVDPPCEVFDALPANLDPDAGTYWQDNPFQLHPGYVKVVDPDDLSGGPYETVAQYDHVYYKSVESWCRALPVVNVNTDDIAVDQAGAEIVVTPGYTATDAIVFADAVANPNVTIYGYNFGPEEGRIKLESKHECINELNTSNLADIVSWSDTAITFRLLATRFVPDLYQITVIRDDRSRSDIFDTNPSRVRSVGRAYLDVRKAIYSDTASPGAALAEMEPSRQFRAIHPFCEGGKVLTHRIWDCTGVAPGELVDCGDDPVGAGTQLYDTVSGPFGPLVGPYPEHQWEVDQAGECKDMSFSGAACPDVLPTYYGLTYVFTRLSENPISVTAQTWRFVLGWEREGAPQP